MQNISKVTLHFNGASMRQWGHNKRSNFKNWRGWFLKIGEGFQNAKLWSSSNSLKSARGALFENFLLFSFQATKDGYKSKEA